MNNIVELKNINKKLGGKVVLENLSFSIKKGEILGFLGQNGAGKSTTMKIISGLLRKNSGEYKFGGEDFKLNHLEKIGSIINHPVLYEELNAYDNLRIFSNIIQKKYSKKDFDDILDLVGLYEDSRKQKVKKYSTGMKQMLSVAVSILGEPKLLVLDEITSGLDVKAKERVRRLLKDLKEKGYSIIFSSHELDQIYKVSDRIVVISDKHIKFEGTIKEMGKYGSDIEESYLNLIS